MNTISIRKLLSFVVVMVFFLTGIPYGHANQSAHPATYEQAKIMEIMKELRLDQENVESAMSQRLSRKRTSALHEFDEVRDLLASTPWESWTKGTIQKAFEMTVERIDPAKAKDLQKRLGISDGTLEKTASLLGVYQWLKEHPVGCAVTLSLVFCLAALIIVIVGVVFAPAWIGTIIFGSLLTTHISVAVIAATACGEDEDMAAFENR